MDKNSHIIESRENINLDHYDIAAGDLSNEIGKGFMERLWKSIDRHSEAKLDKIYFITTIRKDPIDVEKIHIVIQALKGPLSYLRQSMDHWEYDYIKNKLKLLWSIPHRTEMKNFLRAPEKYNKDMIKWINRYLEQDNVNLNDSATKIIKI